MSGNADTDCYVLSLGKEAAVHECLMPLDGPGLPKAVRETEDGKKRGLLLVVLLRERKKKGQASSHNLGPRL